MQETITINLILDKNEKTVFRFFETNAKRILTNDEIDICCKLLEMQKYSMFMFTSCGWFFSEISGLESVQVLQYASRAIDLASQITGKSLELEFKKRLQSAESNLKKYKNGRGVYNKLVASAKKAAEKNLKLI